MPGGKRYYEYQLELHTTLNVDAEEIHRTGLAEVARIRAAMARAQADIGFKGTLAQCFEHLKSDPKYKFATKEALFAAYEQMRERVNCSNCPGSFTSCPPAGLNSRRYPLSRKPRPAARTTSSAHRRATGPACSTSTPVTCLRARSHA